MIFDHSMSCEKSSHVHNVKKKKKKEKKVFFCYNVKYFLFVGKHMFVYVVL
jgi:hypothetical protein